MFAFIFVFFHTSVNVLFAIRSFGLTSKPVFIKKVSMDQICFTLACVFGFITLGLLFVTPSYWWISLFFAVIFSQVSIIQFWKHLKLLTSLNVLLLFAVFLGFLDLRFHHLVLSERQTLYNLADLSPSSPITVSDISHLPQSVQNWMIASGVVGKPHLTVVSSTQDALMKLSPSDTKWLRAKSEQISTSFPPAFIWNVRLRMFGLPVFGVDSFMKGKGSMLIKLLGLVPVVNTRDNLQINEGALQRWLGEIVWVPSAALNPLITWVEVDSKTAHATLAVDGTVGDGTFYFNDDGLLDKFSTMRFQGEADTKTEWVVTIEKHAVTDGYTYPSKFYLTWKLEEGDWDWMKMTVTSYRVNKFLKKF
ncbi:hypothetical protein RCL1_008852 [Eukaryota sp. TZLM3-RCL]